MTARPGARPRRRVVTPPPNAGRVEVSNPSGGPPGAPDPAGVAAAATPTVVDRVSRRLGEAACWLFLVAAAISVYEVFMDSVFRAPSVWVHDSTIMLCATAFMLGGAYAMQRREHVRITVVYDLLSRRAQRWCDLVTLSLALIYVWALAWFTGLQASESIAIVERSGRAWDFPMPMVIRTAFFAGAILLAIQTVANLYTRARTR